MCCALIPAMLSIIEALALAGNTSGVVTVCGFLRAEQEKEAAAAAAVRAEADAVDETRRAAQRAPNRERQRKHRSRPKRCPETSDFFPSNSETDFADAAIAESQPVTPATVTPHKKESVYLRDSDSDSKKIYTTATLCPANWQPSENHYAMAAAKGVGREKVDQLAGEMRAWSEANKHRDCARKADWGAAFNGWIMRQKPVLTVVQGGRPKERPEVELGEWARDFDFDAHAQKLREKYANHALDHMFERREIVT